MTGFSTTYVNQLADDLSDHRGSGSPMWGDLLKSAEVIRSKSLALRVPLSHGSSADRKFISGSPLFVLIAGRLKVTDRYAIHSYAPAATAGSCCDLRGRL